MRVCGNLRALPGNTRRSPRVSGARLRRACAYWARWCPRATRREGTSSAGETLAHLEAAPAPGPCARVILVLRRCPAR